MTQEQMNKCPHCKALAAENRELRELVGEARDFVEDKSTDYYQGVTSGPKGKEKKPCYRCSECHREKDVKPHAENCRVKQAAALLPRLEKVGKG